MTIKDILDPYVLHPVLTSDGRKSIQRCYICGKGINFINRDPHIAVGDLVRHRKCYPEPLR